MPVDNIQAFFFAKKALKGSQLTTKEFTVLAGLHLGGSQSIKSLELYCKANNHCSDYRNMKRMVDKLISARLVNKNGKRVYVSADGMLLLSFVDRKLKKTIAAAA